MVLVSRDPCAIAGLGRLGVFWGCGRLSAVGCSTPVGQGSAKVMTQYLNQGWSSIANDTPQIKP